MTWVLHDIRLFRPSAGHITDRRRKSIIQNFDFEHLFKKITFNTKMKIKIKYVRKTSEEKIRLGAGVKTEESTS